jgi:hypothetical protein
MVRMAPVLAPRKLDGGKPNTDALGIAWVVIAIAYTFVLAGELYLLSRYRSTFCVRIRSLKVVLSAVLTLHIYLVLVLLVYPWNGLFPCSAEFWIMSVFLPSGMAFFQGNLFHLLSRLQLTHLSVQCTSTHSIREPAPIDAKLFGRRSAEAAFIYTQGSVGDMARSRRRHEGLHGNTCSPSPFRKQYSISPQRLS